jgi:hypothetical protein
MVALLVLSATFLSATVLSGPIASAAQSVSATITGPLDGQGNVKVHEQGTADVRSTDTTHVLFAQNVDNTTGGFTFTDTIDVSAWKEIALFVKPHACTSDISIFVQSGLFSNAYLDDNFTVPCGFEGVVRRYELPGVDFRIGHGGGGSIGSTGLVVVGRSN